MLGFFVFVFLLVCGFRAFFRTTVILSVLHAMFSFLFGKR